jgi:hypothetical protein
MGMISSEALAGELGLSHKAVKGLILKFNVEGIPSGSCNMDPGKTQRMVLVDEEAFHSGLSKKTQSFKRKKKKKKEAASTDTKKK